MTDNQKRAHDLALFMLDKADVSSMAEQKTVDGKAVVGIDFYREYKVLYEKLLSAINRDYPGE